MRGDGARAGPGFLDGGHGNLQSSRGFGQRLTVTTRKWPETGIRPSTCDHNQCAPRIWKDSSRPRKGIVGTEKRTDNISDYICFLLRKAVVCALLGDGAFRYL
ncbi:hypothetical protein GCM10027612_35110 [Microbispora bryophytorum subsp. camponoti]